MIRRFAPWLVLLLLLAIAAVVSLLTAQPSNLPPLDTGNAKPDGGLAAYLWMERIDRSVTVDTGLDIRSWPGHGALLLLTPQSALSKSQARGITAWVRDGGSLVLATEGDSANTLVGMLGISVVPAEPARVRIVQPLLLAPPARSLAGTADFVVTGDPRAAVVATSVEGPVLLYRPLGRGTVWLLTARELLDNAHLGKRANRRLLLNLVDQNRPVIFEQYQPAVPLAGSNSWLTTTVWGAALLFLVAVAILYRWLSGLRLGPALPPQESMPRVAAEYVTSLAGLLRQARRRGDVLRMYQQGLERIVVERFGSIENTGRRDELDRLLTPATNLSEQDLIDHTAAIVECEDLLRRERV